MYVSEADFEGVPKYEDYDGVSMLPLCVGHNRYAYLKTFPQKKRIHVYGLKKIQPYETRNTWDLTASPTAPRPKIATLDPAFTLAVFHAAPRPTNTNVSSTHTKTRN